MLTWIIPQGIVQSFFKKPYLVTGHGGDVTFFKQRNSQKVKNQMSKRS